MIDAALDIAEQNPAQALSDILQEIFGTAQDVSDQVYSQVGIAQGSPESVAAALKTIECGCCTPMVTAELPLVDFLELIGRLEDLSARRGYVPAF